MGCDGLCWNADIPQEVLHLLFQKPWRVEREVQRSNCYSALLCSIYCKYRTHMYCIILYTITSFHSTRFVDRPGKPAGVSCLVSCLLSSP